VASRNRGGKRSKVVNNIGDGALVRSHAANHDARSGYASGGTEIVNAIADAAGVIALAVNSGIGGAAAGHIEAHDIDVSAAVGPDGIGRGDDLGAPLLVGDEGDVARSGSAGAAIDAGLLATENTHRVSARSDVDGHAGGRGIGGVLDRGPGMAGASVIRIVSASGDVPIEPRGCACS